MGDSAKKFVLEHRLVFLHEVKKWVKFSKNQDIYTKMALGRGLCNYLVNQGLFLQRCEDDLPNPESHTQLDLFMVDCYQVMDLRTSSYEDFRHPEMNGGKEEVVSRFYVELTEIVDRAVMRFESIYEACTVDSGNR